MALSVVLATFNEAKNLRACLSSVKDIADEIVIVDGSSTDKTVEIAREFGAKVVVTTNPPLFHINKQKALENASNDWILQLDADERVSKKLATQIKKVIAMDEEQIEEYQKTLSNRDLFLRNQEQWEKKQGNFSHKEGEYVGFFIPRLNYFLGRYLHHGGVYPDGAIRLVKKKKAWFPCKDVHEIIQLEGKVGWLSEPLYHWDSPTFSRYLQRNSRYIDLIATELKEKKVSKNAQSFIEYILYKPLHWFLLTYIRHKGFLDSWQGLVFSFFSALRFPRAYIRFLKKS